MPQIMRCVLYLRVSTGGLDTKNQRIVLEDYTARRGWEVVTVYEEAESAWKGGHQRELAKAIEVACNVYPVSTHLNRSATIFSSPSFNA